MSIPPAAFYCVTGRDFFPGVAALLNSLRLCGHTEPLLVLDCGLNARQRELLAPHATVIPAPSDAPPSLQKLVAPMSHPASVMVLLDADLIATRPLTDLIATAARGSLVAFENDTHRHFPEWGELLALGTVRPDPYLTSSAVFIGQEVANSLMPLIEDKQARIDPGRTWLGSGTQADPFYYLDQDVLNAVVHSRLPPDRVVALPSRLAPIPPFRGLRVVDEAALRCRHRDGTEPYVLHHTFRKPWLVPMRSNAYSRLVTRLLLGPDVPLRLGAGDLPRRMRTGPAAAAQRIGMDVVLGVPGVVRRLRRRPPRVTPWPNSRGE